MKKIFKSPWLIIPALLVFSPLGILLMLKYTSWSRGVKTGVVFCAAMLITILFAPAPDSEDRQKDTTKNSTQVIGASGISPTPTP